MKSSFENLKQTSVSPEEKALVDAFTEKRITIVKGSDDIVEAMETITSYTKTFLENHPDARDYKLFHILIGSTPPQSVVKIDYEGQDTVQRLLDTIEEAIKSKNL